MIEVSIGSSLAAVIFLLIKAIIAGWIMSIAFSVKPFSKKMDWSPNGVLNDHYDERWQGAKLVLNNIQRERDLKKFSTRAINQFAIEKEFLFVTADTISNLRRTVEDLKETLEKTNGAYHIRRPKLLITLCAILLMLNAIVIK